MMKWILVVFVAMGFCACSSVSRNPWSEISAPTTGEAQAIGNYTAGCVSGAVSLPPDGRGYQVMRLTRGKFYGHPQLIQFITLFGEVVDERGLGQVLIGNLGQPRGGPTLVGHRSHQNGLDVDVWYWQPVNPNRHVRPRSMTLSEREMANAQNVVRDDGLGVDLRYWTRKHARILQAAAEFETVERIFVHPAIKKELCSTPQKNREWLRKIRPWWGHDDHFHVRLKCPQGNAHCVSQDPVEPGDGCDNTLEWWFSAEAKAEAERMRAEPPEPAKMPELPVECDAVLRGI